MGEDSGLEVKALNNRPGIYSARFAGARATDKKNNTKLLRLLKNVPLKQRQARYRCFAALADGDTLVGVAQGCCRGVIANWRRGSHGFGYDPVFILPRYHKTFGELDPAIKAKVSHRFRALQKFKTMLRAYLDGHKGS